MTAIDLNEYRLQYIRQDDGKRFFVRRVSNNEYVIFNAEENTREKISYYSLRKLFTPCSENLQRVKKINELRVC